MSRQVIDGMIITAVVGLAVAHLYVGGFTGHWVIRPDQPGRSSESAVRETTGPIDAAATGRSSIAGEARRNDARAGAVTVRVGKWMRLVDGGAQQSQPAPNGGTGAGSSRWTANVPASESHTSSAPAHPDAAHPTNQIGGGVARTDTGTDSAANVVSYAN